MTFDSRYKFNSMAVSGIVIFMKIHVDAEKCQGHNRCYALAPELEDRARLALANCPEFAITISE